MTDDSAGAGAAGDRGTNGDAISDLTLAEVLAAAAEELDGVVVTGADDVTTWSASDRAFATLAGDRAEFHLDPLVARAALRTPDTSASPRGPEWVGFEPASVDDAAIDRAEAWFLSAHRRATGPRR